MTAAAHSIAVVIPVFNRPGPVVEALESVAAQTVRPTLTVVVDDGSTDDTASRVEAWIASSGAAVSTRLVRQAHAGVSAARNRAIAEAGVVEFLAFLDSDDAWPRDHLERLSQALLSQPRAVAASTEVKSADASLNPGHACAAGQLTGNAAAIIFDRYCPIPSSTMVRANHFAACGGFDPRYQGIEDLDLFLRLSLRGHWAYASGAAVVYRHLPDALRHRAALPEQVAAQIDLLERFLATPGARAAVPLFRRRRHLASLWHRLGKLRLAQGDGTGARACFRRAVGSYPLYYRSVARLLRFMG